MCVCMCMRMCMCVAENIQFFDEMMIVQLVFILFCTFTTDLSASDAFDNTLETFSCAVNKMEGINKCYLEKTEMQEGEATWTKSQSKVVKGPNPPF